MDTTVTNQLNNEIEKLKVGDYTSYQNFYSQTSGYIYQIVCSNVGEQEAANWILNEVYTDIYNTIGVELTDNSRFFEWAGNKAQTVTDTYIVTHNIVVNKESKDTLDKVAVAAATNVGMNVLDGSWNAAGAVVEEGTGQIGYVTTAGESGQIGYGSAAGQSGQVGYGSSVGQSGQVGYGTALREGGQAGYGENMSGSMNRPDNVMPQNGNMPGNNVPGNVVSGNAASGSIAKPLAGAIAKPAMSIGAKVAIGIATAAVVIGGVVATVTLANKDKDDEETTTGVEVIVDDGTSEEISSEEITSEEAIDPELVARATSYYNMIVNPDGTMQVIEDEKDFSSVMAYSNVRLVDFNGDGNKQLVVVDNQVTSKNHMVHVYDYVDGKAVSILDVDFTNTGYNFTAAAISASYVDLVYKPDGTACLVVYDPDEDGPDIDHTVRKFVYDNGVMSVETVKKDDFKYYNEAGYSYECLASDGATPYAAMYVSYNEIRSKSISKIKYDEVIEELVSIAGIDTSSVWKTVYMNKIQQLEETLYAQDFTGTQNEGAHYRFALKDLNGDGIPELIGLFMGWSGGSHFIMTCSKYGTFDYISLYRSMDASIVVNSVNSTDGYVRTKKWDTTMTTDDLLEDKVYYITRGTMICIGKMEKTYSDVDKKYLREWIWKDYGDSERTNIESLSESDFESKTSAYGINQELYSVCDFVETLDEIKTIIKNYE